MIAVDHNPDALVQPRQILVATDLCDSNYLLPVAIAQAKATGAHLTLVHAFINPSMPSMTAQPWGRQRKQGLGTMPESRLKTLSLYRQNLGLSVPPF